MKTIIAQKYSIFFESQEYKSLTSYLKKTSFSTLFILVDSHTKNKCLPIFLSKIGHLHDFEIITIPAGEHFKNLETCQYVWSQLTNLKADRDSVLINIGGGMLTDLGGFTASTFKRGIRFINVSTSLLGMVDASIGGKTGVDLNMLKNQIGLFANPELVLIDTNYLATLPKRELISGMAEIIKYGLSYDQGLWSEIRKESTLNQKKLKNWIHKSIFIKNEIVTKDPKEKTIRKILNFGHTIGHAIETFFLQNKNKQDLTHGEAIAIGIICETYISNKYYNISDAELKLIKTHIIDLFGKVNFNSSDYPTIFNLMKHDKKNINGQVQFVLLEKLGSCKINCEVPENLIVDALNFYLD